MFTNSLSTIYCFCYARKLETEQITIDGLQDVSISDAAQRAGVSPRTVYRYFPNREALIDAMEEWVEQQLGEIPYPTTPDEIADSSKIAFSCFEAKATLVQALLLTHIGRHLRPPLDLKRCRAIATALQSIVEHLPSEEAAAKIAVIQHLTSAAMWQTLHQEYNISREKSGEVVAWAIQTLVTNLPHQNLPNPKTQ